ncbi:MBL fold metallo-hydrolase [Thiorhodovibrio frisius]|uniref:Zn-dependent hydrolase, glyoxylase n=1 Tax=Thiorhodovibrio frisius TaxID=631362 RepID=H8Z8L7_9GAMM|nr:MBL fold metallo-hydrolase [Thiorhodovibrio frisius]EIC19422.1 Zn-dependent hydrolase, glyoxylase [Thiorhodovibrio frisius]WPL22276.1 putative polyketide biosynthesis zinc-dependent hydrolase PksB [Thiorhodovibrio frisius]
MLVELIPVTDFQQNCTLLLCEQTREAVIVDPGGEPERIIATLKRLGAKPKRLLLTHGHLDHVGAAPELARALELPILGPHRDDAFLLEALPQQAQMFGFPPHQAFTPDAWLEAGESIRFGEECLKVLHCPGHSPGHLVYFDSSGSLAQVGDVLFRGAIGRTDLPRGNHEQLLRSIREVLLPLGDHVRFIPGHGPMSSLGAERRDNPFLASAH